MAKVRLVIAGNFLVGVVVFLIIVTVDFIVITKGASRIAEVGARFTLDSIPGKQMAIDAELSAGIIDEARAKQKRQELEEESAFFGAMDGASRFVRGDAVAGLIITAINVVVGITVGTQSHGMPIDEAIDVFARLSIGDGLASQVPALITSLAAGLVVAKGGSRSTADQAVLGQLGKNPRAIYITAAMMLALSGVPGLPFSPFFAIAIIAASVGLLRKQREKQELAFNRASPHPVANGSPSLPSVRGDEFNQIEISVWSKLAVTLMRRHEEVESRLEKIRTKIGRELGFALPKVGIVTAAGSDRPDEYSIIAGGIDIGAYKIPAGKSLVIVGNGPVPSVGGEETREPAFHLRSVWVPEAHARELKRDGFTAVDPVTIVLTHLSEVIRENAAQLFSYSALQTVLEALPQEYRRLLDDVRPAHISNTGLQSVLKSLLAERVSIRNIRQIVEAVAEAAPNSHRIDEVVEFVRQRLKQQICSDLAKNNGLSIIRVGPRWDGALLKGAKRNQQGEVVDLEVDARTLEEFGRVVANEIGKWKDIEAQIVIVTGVTVRRFVKAVAEQFEPGIAVLSTAELAKLPAIKMLSTID